MKVRVTHIRTAEKNDLDGIQSSKRSFSTFKTAFTMCSGDPSSYKTKSFSEIYTYHFEKWKNSSGGRKLDHCCLMTLPPMAAPSPKATQLKRHKTQRCLLRNYMLLKMEGLVTCRNIMHNSGNVMILHRPQHYKLVIERVRLNSQHSDANNIRT
jgi:hypothetical protein